MTKLLILAALRIERAAIGHPTAAHVLRTGMGPGRARIAAARALAHDAPAVAVAGVCAAIDPGLRPGDVVCATELRSAEAAPVELADSDRLLACLRGRGLDVRCGAIFSGDRILPPFERARLAGEALAVDMESAWLAAGAGGRPFAVVRVVADAAGRRLTDPRIALAGARALLNLHRVGEALGEWAAGLDLTAPPAVPASALAGLEVPAAAIVELARSRQGGRH